MARLLVIDDDFETDAVRWFFQSREFDLDVVKDPVAGLRQAQTARPDTIIVSSSFGASYITELALLLRCGVGTPAARLIALADSADCVEDAGADAIVVRPFHLEYLYQVVVGTAPVAHT